MSTEILINVSLQESRVALVENNVLTEISIERHRDRGIAGNIYKGRVVRVLPGMQAAFVDVGLERAAFLYVTEVLPQWRAGMGGEADEAPAAGERQERYRQKPDSPGIESLLRDGQDVVVQATKEPLGTKGAQITTHITLPGRYLVYMPTFNHIGVSRRIENDKKRAQLRKIMDQIRPEGAGGFIVRTASEDHPEQDLKSDMDYLLKVWGEIQQRSQRASSPSIIHRELSLDLKVIRDLFSENVSRVVVDSPEQLQEIKSFMEQFLGGRSDAVELYQGERPLFESAGVEMEIARALERRVWLKSGGYIVMDQTEALTVVDVNTGRYVGRRNFEDTILKTNLEALKELVYQLRLRNIGGLIIIDFIDMANPQNRERVYQTLEDELRKDKTKTTILKMSELGLVEMTRKRARENLYQALCEPCPYCEGKGYLKSRTTVCYEIFREIRKDGPSLGGKRVNLFVNPEVADLLFDEEREGVEELEREFNVQIEITVNNSFHQEQFEVEII
ncbi:MAG TPA: Rne/Rng family ribonuclease [bacterium]|nr:Rne/Rng family ribonuclease [bacterium]